MSLLALRSRGRRWPCWLVAIVAALQLEGVLILVWATEAYLGYLM